MYRYSIYDALDSNKIEVIKYFLNNSSRNNDFLQHYICGVNIYNYFLDINIIKLLLEYGTCINFLNDRTTILHTYFNVNYKNIHSIEIIKLFITYGVDLSIKDKYKNTVLHKYFSTKYISLDIVKILVENGADISELDCYNLTVVHSYMFKLDVDITILTYLLDNVKNKSPFKHIVYYYLRCIKPKIHILKMLINKFGINLIDNYHIIDCYIFHCHIPDADILELLINNINCKSNNINDHVYNTLEHYLLLHYNDISIVTVKKFLKLFTCNKDQYIKRLLSKYISTSKNVEYSVVKYLHSIIKIPDELPGYPLHYYCFNKMNDIKIFKIILSNYNIDINDVNQDGMTILQLAIKNNLSDKIIKYIISKGADINIIDCYNNSILYTSLLYSKNSNVIRTILKAKPSLKIIHQTISSTINISIVKEKLLKEFIYISVPIYKEEFINKIISVVNVSESISNIVKKCYYDICKMNKCILYKSIPMVDLINYSIDTLSRYVNNNELIQTVNELTIYKNNFNRRLKKAKKRIHFLNHIDNYFGYIINDWNLLPHELKNKIFSYLKNKDLIFILKCKN
ncbi:ankyrin repeat protein [Cotia virus SPAn232]|uniref:Ankyrin repeat protein n=2 Tax=Cotia virus TaxID=39444 RepID=H6TAF2_9POXV|nr:ankyrin repeat protein [Cotia virus SPAn232]YP_005296372.1 ankyrin repeat protein [Cotia virus SPAn232]AIT70617.1 ankyrin repeat protein [Cotia virus]AFB76892.1 ankyrin repeat protein [Cotia virus SPAn232]AFB76986.1 ankyrin repeat protein [Cotia virus SPAn232]AIT70799.1 ankyrin repeat protein [Cotia virus]